MRICDLKDDQLVGSVVRSLHFGGGGVQGVITRAYVDPSDNEMCIIIHWLGMKEASLAGARYELLNEVLHIGGSNDEKA